VQDFEVEDDAGTMRCTVDDAISPVGPYNLYLRQGVRRVDEAVVATSRPRIFLTY